MRIKEHAILPKVLRTLANGTIAIATSSGHTSRSVYDAFRKFDVLQALSSQQLAQSVRYAVGNRYIRILRIKGVNYIEITQKGNKFLGKEAIQALRLNVPKTWDKLYRVVLFDIPEAHKGGRDGFASNLKKIGCIQIQKSAFAFPYPCFEEVEVLADFHRVSNFVSYLEVVSLTPAQRFHKHFKLGAK